MSWKKVEINKVGFVQGGYAFSSTEYKSSGIPIIRISNINDDEIELNGNTVFVDEVFLKTKQEFLVGKDDVLIAMSGATTGKFGIYNLETPSLLNQRVGRIKLNPEAVDKKYFYYFMFQIQKIILKNSYGAAIPNISPSIIAKIQIPVPPLLIQQKIAAILDKADALRKKDQQLLKKYDKLLQSIFYKMFGDPVKNEKGWEKKNLRELCHDFKYGTNEKSFEIQDPNAIPIIRIPNVLNNEVNFDNLKFSVLSADELRDVQLEIGDLLFVRTNGNPSYIGRCAVYNDKKIAGYASYLIRTKIKNKEEALPEFIQTVISYNTYRPLILKKATTTAGNYNINTVSLKSLIIPVPPIKLQKEFFEITKNIRVQKAQIKQQIKNSESLFQSLLQKAFKGELVQ
jgi:type I restriction enzyme S subunit